MLCFIVVGAVMLCFIVVGAVGVDMVKGLSLYISALLPFTGAPPELSDFRMLTTFPHHTPYAYL